MQDVSVSTNLSAALCWQRHVCVVLPQAQDLVSLNKEAIRRAREATWVVEQALTQLEDKAKAEGSVYTCD
jgi:hypothetical protein